VVAVSSVSATFHGRDVFSPAAAHLANGLAVEELGQSVEAGSLERLEIPQPEVTDRRIRACCLYVDRFGNMQLNVTRKQLDQLGIGPGRQVELELATERYYAIAARTFTDARGGEIILYEDAYENIAIALSGGSAAETFSARPGVDVRIRVAD
jgi:S-adenosylmethionine hydrolase